MVRARMRKLTGVVNPATGTMTVANGLALNYKDGTATDGVHGTAIWDTDYRNCTEQVSRIYEGVVEVHRLNKKGRENKMD